MDYANTKTLFYYINTYSNRIKNVSSDQISNYYIDCQLIENKPTRISSKGWSEIKVGRILFDKEVK
jgi:DNA mismatch repair protein MutS